MNKHLLFLTLGLLVSTFASAQEYYGEQSQEYYPTDDASYAQDVEYTPQAQETYYTTGAPWYGSSHDRWGYHKGHAQSPFHGTSWRHSKRARHGGHSGHHKGY
jgi:hypothetical protein